MAQEPHFTGWTIVTGGRPVLDHAGNFQLFGSARQAKQEAYRQGHDIAMCQITILGPPDKPATSALAKTTRDIEERRAAREANDASRVQK